MPSLPPSCFCYPSAFRVFVRLLCIIVISVWLSLTVIIPASAHHTSLSHPLSGHQIRQLYAEILFLRDGGHYSQAWALALSHLDVTRYPETLFELTVQLAHQTQNQHLFRLLASELEQRYPHNRLADLIRISDAFHRGECIAVLNISEELKQKQAQLHHTENSHSAAVASYVRTCQASRWDVKRTVSFNSYRSRDGSQEYSSRPVIIHPGSFISDICSVFTGVCPASGQLEVQTASARTRILNSTVDILARKSAGQNSLIETGVRTALISSQRRLAYAGEMIPHAGIAMRLSPALRLTASARMTMSRLYGNEPSSSVIKGASGSVSLWRQYLPGQFRSRNGVSLNHVYHRSGVSSEHHTTIQIWSDLILSETATLRLETAQGVILRPALHLFGDSQIASSGLELTFTRPLRKGAGLQPEDVASSFRPDRLSLSYHRNQMTSSTVLPWMTDPYFQHSDEIKATVNFTHHGSSISPYLGIRIVDSEANTVLLDENYSEILAGISFNF